MQGSDENHLRKSDILVPFGGTFFPSFVKKCFSQ